MGRYRIYPLRDNTLLETSEINTGINEVMELWYGEDGVTRHFVKFNTEEYNEKYNLGLVPHITASTSTFHMFNCYPTPELYDDSTTRQANGVDLSVKMVQQNWAEGRGHDFIGLDTSEGISNWYCATTITSWAAPGGDFLYEVFSGYIDAGYEDFSGSVQNEIKLWDAFTGTDFGLAVKYTDPIEALTGDPKTVLKFYTRETNTYKIPYIQFDWDNQITDERDEVMSGTTKKLYFYLKNNGEFTNANSVSGVSLSFSDSAVTHNGFTGSSIYNPMPGIYYVNFDCPTATTASTVFTDSWTVQYEAGMDYQSVSQSGTVHQLSSAWDVSQSDVVSLVDYKIVTPTLKPRYEKGTRIFLEINNYIPFTNNKVIHKGMEYKIEIKDGYERFVMVDWGGVSYTQTDNFIMIETDWLIEDNLYVISFRHSEDGSTIYSKDEKEFRII